MDVTNCIRRGRISRSAASGVGVSDADRFRRSAAPGQALIETMLVLPFFMLMMMALAEFGIYFYRSNLMENTIQHMGRMAARNATHTQLDAYMDDKLTSFSNLALEVQDTAGVAITEWSSSDAIEITVSGTVAPVMPIGVFNYFAPGTEFFPSEFTMTARKQVYVE
ncbi:pilus assembly protein [bacterium]|nr:pilus assembly protein [bacterium]